MSAVLVHLAARRRACCQAPARCSNAIPVVRVVCAAVCVRVLCAARVCVCVCVCVSQADRMIDLGFEPQVQSILDAMPLTNQKPEDEDIDDVDHK